MSIYWHDIEDLAAAICGMDEDSCGADVEQALYEEFEVSFEMFSKLIAVLAPMTPAAVSPLTGQQYSGFVKDGAFIVKVPYKMEI